MRAVTFALFVFFNSISKGAWTASESNRCLQSALTTLQGEFFSPSRGTFPESIDWTAAFISTVLSSTSTSLDSHRYFSHLVSFFHRQNTAALRWQAYDDQQWVVLGWLLGAEYAATMEPEWVAPFRTRARDFYRLVEQGWDESTCQGGMLWKRKDDPDVPYKNTITNELFIASSIEMYRHFGHEVYLENALRAWNWLSTSELRNSQGLFADGLHNCTGVQVDVWTYNQGVILSGLAGLTEYTGSDSFIEEGHQLIQSVMRWLTSSDQILRELCDEYGECNQDQQTFKGIFFHHMARFCKHANCSRYREFVEHNAEAAWKTRLGSSNGLIGDNWAAWPYLRTVETHAGGVAVLGLHHMLTKQI